MLPQEIFIKILEDFKAECLQRKIDFSPKFANFFIHLLVRDARVGLDFKQISVCKWQDFLGRAIRMYEDPLDPTMCNIKMMFYFENCPEVDLEAVQEKYAKESNEKIQKLIDGILRYPENSNDKQLEEMLMQIQIYIVANYNLGCANNHVLLKQTRQSLNSVIGYGDLKAYVLKKKHHRLEYLRRLGATVCGILIYNNHGPTGDKENMRDILVDLEMAKQNTKESFDETLKRCAQCKKYGFRMLNEIIRLDPVQKLAHGRLPVEKVLKTNKFVALFCVFERCLQQLNARFLKTEYLIEVGQNKLKCIIEKIDDVLRFRTAIDSEVIFPHFVYLSEIWTSLVLYLNHLTELNKLKARMDDIITPELELSFAQIVDSALTASVQMRYTIEPTFEQLVARAMKRSGNGNLLKISDSINDYCALTIALTGGLLVPAHIHKKLCEDLNLKFGFANIELAKYAERNFEEFLTTLQNVLFTTVDLLLVFQLHKVVLEQDVNEAAPITTMTPNTQSLQTQTEMVIENDLSIANRINVTWNKWDFHRETIRLANLRRKQTHSAQTVVTYGRRNAQTFTNLFRHDVKN